MFSFNSFVFLLSIGNVFSGSIYIESVINSTSKTLYSQFVNTTCENRNNVCAHGVNVCAMKIVNDKMAFKDFQSSCELFVSNMCEYEGNEYFIIKSGTCKEYLSGRRNVQMTEHNVTDSISLNKSNSTKYNLRQKTTTKIPSMYDIDTAFDNHVCPLSCPDTYSPICLSVNRGYGKYFKFFTFMNHCHGDVYYCKNWEEFSPPPDEDVEMVNSSPLGWSYCGASRYLQFNRFSEVASSMGHYGWLEGNQKYSHIMAPRERMLGYG